MVRMQQNKNCTIEKKTLSNYSWAFRHGHVFRLFSAVIFVDVNIENIDGTFVLFSQREKKGEIYNNSTSFDWIEW